MRSNSGGFELVRVASELTTVGRERQLVEGAGLQVPSERLEQAHNVSAHQQFAAGDAERVPFRSYNFHFTAIARQNTKADASGASVRSGIHTTKREKEQAF